MPTDTIKIPGKFESVIEKVKTVANELGVKAYAVGGFVRDLYGGAKQPKDIDVVVDIRDKDGAIKFAEALKAKYGLADPIPHPNKYFTCAIKIDGQMVDIAVPRVEEYSETSNDPERVDLATIEEDALRRDFSMNSLYYQLNPDAGKESEILDFTGHGKKDIKEKVVRFANIEAPDKTFTDDPIRMLRAIAFNKSLGYAIDQQVQKAIEKNAIWFEKKNIKAEDESGNVSYPMGDAIKRQFEKILSEDKPGDAFRLMQKLGLLKAVVPELAATDVEHNNKHHTEKILEHILMVLDRIPKNESIALKFAAIMHDLGKVSEEVKTNEKNKLVDGLSKYIGHEKVSADMVEPILTRFGIPKDIKTKVKFLVEHHMDRNKYVGNTGLDATWSDTKIRNFVSDMGEHLDDILKIMRADISGREGHNSGEGEKLIDKLQDHSYKVKPSVDAIRKDPILGSEEIISIVNEYMSKKGKPTPVRGDWIARLKDALMKEQFKHVEWDKENPKDVDEAKKVIKSLVGNPDFMASRKAWLSIGWLDVKNIIAVDINNISDEFKEYVKKIPNFEETTTDSGILAIIYDVATKYDPTSDKKYVEWIFKQINGGTLDYEQRTRVINPSPLPLLSAFECLKKAGYLAGPGPSGVVSIKLSDDINSYTALSLQYSLKKVFEMDPGKFDYVFKNIQNYFKPQKDTSDSQALINFERYFGTYSTTKHEATEDESATIDSKLAQTELPAVKDPEYLSFLQDSKQKNDKLGLLVKQIEGDRENRESLILKYSKEIFNITKDSPELLANHLMYLTTDDQIKAEEILRQVRKPTTHRVGPILKTPDNNNKQMPDLVKQREQEFRARKSWLATKWIVADKTPLPTSPGERADTVMLEDYFQGYPGGQKMDKQMPPKQDMGVDLATGKRYTGEGNGEKLACPNCGIILVVKAIETGPVLYCSYCGHTQNDSSASYYNPDAHGDTGANPAISFDIIDPSKIGGNPDAYIPTVNRMDGDGSN